MNRQIRRLGIALLALYLALFVQLNWVHVIKASEYNANPANTRAVVRDFARERGAIQTADGVIVARSVDSNDRFKKQREYPEGDLFAHVAGYFSFTFGATGVEKQYNAELAGRTAELELRGLGDLFVDRTRTADVTLSIRKDVQQVAKDALGARQGAVVALDPKTGAVLALWSFPSFDANRLALHDFDKVTENRDLLLLAPGNPLVASAYRERNFPGSTFKIVTASAGLETGKVTPEEPVFPTEQRFTPPQTTRPLSNFGGSTCGGALFEILRVSCNTAFARMGLEVGADAMNERSEAYGFNNRPPIDLSPGAVQSTFPDAGFFDQNLPALAQSAIGQNSVQATPLQMALAAAGIANDGVIMRPQVMAEISDSDGDVLERANPKKWRTAISPRTAQLMRQGMLEVVANGTARGLAIPGVEVGGKTGTAQLGTDPPTSNAWIVGFAGPPGDPQVAVAVIVEGQRGVSEITGGQVAAPIARAVMEKILQVRSQPIAPGPGDDEADPGAGGGQP